LGSLNHLGKSHRSAGPKRFNVIIRDPYSEFSRPLQVASPDCANRYSTSFEPANEWATMIRAVLLTLWSDMRTKSTKQKQSLNIENWWVLESDRASGWGKWIKVHFTFKSFAG
jgi:hypothetical protein